MSRLIAPYRALSRLPCIALYALTLLMLAVSASGYLKLMEYITWQ